MSAKEWRAKYEAIAHECSRLAADLDDLFSSQPPDGHRIADCLGLREDLRGVRDTMLHRLEAITPEDENGECAR